MTEFAMDPQIEIAARQKAADEFSIARSNAINGYARLESHLGMIFEPLSGAEIQRPMQCSHLLRLIRLE